MTSRLTVLGSLVLAPVTALALTSCGGSDPEAEPKQPDRTEFVTITSAGVAAVVERHLGDRVESYTALNDVPSGSAPKGGAVERSIEVQLSGEQDGPVVVSVYPPDGGGDLIAQGQSAPGADRSDPDGLVSCTPTEGGGNVTITRLAFNLNGGSQDGSYVAASGTGPEERKATVSVESASKKSPLTDEEITTLLADPDLGWETDPAINEAGEELDVAAEKP